MSCGVGHRSVSDLVWLWLWRALAATALVRPLAWELTYATGMALNTHTHTHTHTHERNRAKKFQRSRIEILTYFENHIRASSALSRATLLTLVVPWLSFHSGTIRGLV